MFRAVPPATRALIVVNVVVYLLELYAPNRALSIFALWPLHSPQFRWWQLITYAFLHDPSQWVHIFFNMFALFMFGRGLEQYWGSRRFSGYYFVCLISAALTQLAVENAGGVQEPVLGASGAVFGVLLAFAWYFPRTRLILIPIPIPKPASHPTEVGRFRTMALILSVMVPKVWPGSSTGALPGSGWVGFSGIYFRSSALPDPCRSGFGLRTSAKYVVRGRVFSSASNP